jgi:hypothetical protein
MLNPAKATNTKQVVGPALAQTILPLTLPAKQLCPFGKRVGLPLSNLAGHRLPQQKKRPSLAAEPFLFAVFCFLFAAGPGSAGRLSYLHLMHLLQPG